MKSNLGHKVKPCYIGPMVVLHHMQNSSYHLAELNSTMLNLRFAAFYLVPYHTHSCSSIPVMHLINCDDLACIIADEDVTRANPNDV